MNFRANSLQPVAAATGVASRVQLPAAGRLSTNLLDLAGRQPKPAAAAVQHAPRGHMSQYRAQHRAECRAACMSKANF
jgi:hypothetical protein